MEDVGYNEWHCLGCGARGPGGVDEMSSHARQCAQMLSAGETRREIRKKALLEAAESVQRAADCNEPGCDYSALSGAAEMLRELADKEPPG